MRSRYLLDVLSARAWWVVVGTIVVGASALIVALLLPRTYVAEARVLVSGSDSGMAILGRGTGSTSLQPERDMATEARLVESRPVASTATSEANLNMTAADLLDALVVSPVGQTNILAIRASARTPEDAARIANAVSQAYIESSTQQKRDSIGRVADKVEARLEVLGASIQALRKKGSGKASKTGNQTIQESIDQKSIDRYSVLALQLDQMRLSQESATGSGRLVSDASADPEAFSPNPRRAGLLGLLVGFLISVATVLMMSPSVEAGESDTEKAPRAESAD